MFDDYEFKSKEIYEFSFKQKREGSTLPWEMASFINDVNTIYYKQDLLNSISTALLNNISPKDIFIFDGTLSLSRKFNNLDLFNESELPNLFYEVGHPYAIIPNLKTYKIKFLFEVFNKINSLLKQHRFQCLRVKTLNNLISNLDESEYIEKQISSIINIASEKTIYLCKRQADTLNRQPINPDESI